jgi:hypothetical protein
LIVVHEVFNNDTYFVFAIITLQTKHEDLLHTEKEN